ncbi:Appr-1-p processing protein [Streptomyces rapamycinicus NRRL 5491]|uniref:O-acetyl-ADP-ribose deacetylase (Regulator of RNase III) n=1 Tax=Streptomyces rapamycinicus TaxID=1226757 RepID=A0ABR6M1N7_9ACTN|nr:Appr-1-p processing protein [Streptomyces rapamycinicus]AGP60486.1 Appr-1-p processing protein [Streptomyces rapamycinicus NRRL 5491]MBB4788349.1 O-acetyl-ADP-ribose deacetylase (regulator of RNase III) [Streptomyces rapamycinicus]UTP36050.1 Appr-1-p processing protein [Streptomyces rapamycinicus NRRL 5491]
MPTYDQLLEELKSIRRPGLPDLRSIDRPALRAAAVAGGFCDGSDDAPAGIEALLKEAVRRLGERDLLGQAAAHTFGLLPDRRGAPAHDRRKTAAAVYGVTSERFRKHQEPQVVQQLAEAVLTILREPPPLSGGPGPTGRSPGPGAGARLPAEPSAAGQSTLARGGRVSRIGQEPPLRVDSVPVDAQSTFTLHVSPIELLRDIEVLVSSENVYLEMSKTFRPTVSGALRLAAAVRDPAGEIVDDVLARELAAWLRAHGRPGLPIRPGTVVPTSPGALAARGVRRIYHAAVATPLDDTYEVRPESIARAVSACFALARAERDRYEPALSSICFPLLGAGRGGLAPAVSATWLRWAIRDELARDARWRVHLVVRSREIAEAVGAL